jgi:hypothetical protein
MSLEEFGYREELRRALTRTRDLAIGVVYHGVLAVREWALSFERRCT